MMPKHAGAEGPIAEAVSGRHIYVYGSLGTHTADEMEERRAAGAVGREVVHRA